jgi:hypothetical protein
VAPRHNDLTQGCSLSQQFVFAVMASAYYVSLSQVRSAHCVMRRVACVLTNLELMVSGPPQLQQFWLSTRSSVLNTCMATSSSSAIRRFVGQLSNMQLNTSHKHAAAAEQLYSLPAWKAALFVHGDMLNLQASRLAAHF